MRDNATCDFNLRVAIHLTSGDAAQIDVIFQIVIFWSLSVIVIPQTAFISTRSRAATEHRAADKTVGDSDLGIFIHRAILARTIHRADDDVGRGIGNIGIAGNSRFEVDVHLGFAYDSQGVHDTQGAHIASCRAIHIAARRHGSCHSADMAAANVDGSFACIPRCRIIRIR